MLCKECQTEMIVDSVTTNEDSETFNYKCKNPQCPKYGYKQDNQD